MRAPPPIHVVFRWVLDIGVILLLSVPLLFLLAAFPHALPSSILKLGFQFWFLFPIFVGLIVLGFHLITKFKTIGQVLFFPPTPSLLTWILLILAPVFGIIGLALTHEKLEQIIKVPRPFAFAHDEPKIVFKGEIPLDYSVEQPGETWPEALLEVRHESGKGMLFLGGEPLCTVSLPLYLDFRMHSISESWEDTKFSLILLNDNGRGIVEGIQGNLQAKGIVTIQKKGEWCIETTILLQRNGIGGDVEKTLNSLAMAISLPTSEGIDLAHPDQPSS